MVYVRKGGPRALSKLLVLWTLSGLVLPASSQQRASDKLFVLDTRGHMGDVRGVAFTPDGSFVISCGADKVARVWDPKSQKLVRELRGPIGRDYVGELYSVATYPDQKLPYVVLGGHCSQTTAGRDLSYTTHSDIRVYNYETGDLRLDFPAYDDGGISAFAFSPSDLLLVAGNAPPEGQAGLLTCWNITGIHAIPEKSFKGGQRNQGAIEAISFSHGGSWMATADNAGYVCLWKWLNHQAVFYTYLTSTGFSNKPVPANGGFPVYSLSWDPSGQYLAAGFGPLRGQPKAKRGVRRYSQTSQLALVWSIASEPAIKADLDRVSHPDLSKLSTVKCMSFSSDGSNLWFGGDDGKVRSWPWESKIPISESASFEIAPDIAPGYKDKLPDSWIYSLSRNGTTFVSTGSGGQIHVFDEAHIAKSDVQLPPQTNRIGQPIWSLSWSKDGRYVGFSNQLGAKTFRAAYDCSFGMDVSQSDLDRWGLSSDSSYWEENLRSKIDTSPIEERDDDAHYYINRSVGPAKRDDLAWENDENDQTTCSLPLKGNRLILGTNYSLLIYRMKPGERGKPASYFRDPIVLVGHMGAITQLALSPNQKWLASSSLDGTVRLWRIPDGPVTNESVGMTNNAIQPTLTIFDDFKGGWVAWHPDGYFAASPMGENLVGFQETFERRQTPKFAPTLCQFVPVLYCYGDRFQFYRPDVLQKLVLMMPPAGKYLSDDEWLRQAYDAARSPSTGPVAETTSEHGPNVREAAPERHDMLATPLPFHVLDDRNKDPVGAPSITEITITPEQGTQAPDGSFDTKLDAVTLSLQVKNADGAKVFYRVGFRPYVPSSQVHGESASLHIELDGAQDNRVDVSIERSDKTRTAKTVVVRSSAPAVTQGETYAMGVGVNHGSLLYAHADAEAFVRLVQSNEEARSEDKCDTVILGDDATKGEIKSKITWAVEATHPDDSLLILLAGHGYYDNPAQPCGLVLGSHQGENPDEGLLTPLDLKAAVEAAITQDHPSGRVFVFGDFCHSGEYYELMTADTSATKVDPDRASQNTTSDNQATSNSGNTEESSRSREFGKKLNDANSETGQMDLATQYLRACEGTGCILFPAVSIGDGKGQEADRLAFESDKLEHGYFSFCLMMALRCGEIDGQSFARWVEDHKDDPAYQISLEHKSLFADLASMKASNIQNPGAMTYSDICDYVSGHCVQIFNIVKIAGLRAGEKADARKFYVGSPHDVATTLGWPVITWNVIKK